MIRNIIILSHCQDLLFVIDLLKEVNTKHQTKVILVHQTGQDKFVELAKEYIGEKVEIVEEPLTARSLLQQLKNLRKLRKLKGSLFKVISEKLGSEDFKLFISNHALSSLAGSILIDQAMRSGMKIFCYNFQLKYQVSPKRLSEILWLKIARQIGYSNFIDFIFWRGIMSGGVPLRPIQPFHQKPRVLFQPQKIQSVIFYDRSSGLRAFSKNFDEIAYYDWLLQVKNTVESTCRLQFKLKGHPLDLGSLPKEDDFFSKESFIPNGSPLEQELLQGKAIDCAFSVNSTSTNITAYCGIPSVCLIKLAPIKDQEYVNWVISKVKIEYGVFIPENIDELIGFLVDV